MSNANDSSLSGKQLIEEMEQLRSRLDEAEQTLNAIRNGEVDAVVVSGPRGDRIYSLSGAESVYRVVVETMNEAALVVSFDGTIIFCNNRFCEILKESMEEIVGRKISEFILSSQKDSLITVLSDAQHGMIKRRIILCASDSTSIPVMFSTSLLGSDGGQNICLVATNLTELEDSISSIFILKEQQKKLEEKEAELIVSRQAAINLMDDAIEARKREEGLNDELRVEMEVRKRAEKALLESSKRVTEILESISDAFFSLDREWRFTYINNRASENLGFSPDSLVGKNIWETFRSNLGIEQQAYYRKAMDERVKVEFETHEVKGSGWYSIRLYPSVEGISVYVVDITERKRVEEALKGAYENLHAQSEELLAGNEELQAQSEELQAQSEELHSVNEELQTQSEKLKAKSEELLSANDVLQKTNMELEHFAYVASHDLQEPLRMVTSFTQLLESRYKDRFDEEALEYFTFIVDGAKRMQRLIEDLLQFSRVGRTGGEECLVDCNDIVDKVKLILSSHIDDTAAEITYDDLPVLSANETRLIQLFQNLVANAIKFHKKGESPRVHISARRDRGNWLFSVKDNGIGIKPKYFEKIFVIFQRLNDREEYSGTGIGLAISKKIVELYGGKIWVESAEGEGATFYFTFPA